MLKKGHYLNDYSLLVAKVKNGIKSGLTRRQAIRNAVNFCIANQIMKDYLENYSEEVFNMLALQWDKDSALKASFDDGFDDGLTKGVESVAVKMLYRGKSFDEIHADTDLSFERIAELASNLKK